MNAASSWILMVTILGIGMVAGLTTIRDQAVQQLGDVALALENLDQSFSYTVGSKSGSFVDGPPILAPVNDSPACIDITDTAPGNE